MAERYLNETLGREKSVTVLQLMVNQRSDSGQSTRVWISAREKLFLVSKRNAWERFGSLTTHYNVSPSYIEPDDRLHIMMIGCRDDRRYFCSVNLEAEGYKGISEGKSRLRHQE